MTTELQVEEIRRLRVGPGETLVVTLPAGVTPEYAEGVKHALEDRLPGVKILVISRDVSLSVVKDERLAEDQP